MFKKILIFLVILSFGISLNLSAQNNTKRSKDLDEGWEDEYELFGWNGDSRPFIEFNYGLGKAKHRHFTSTFSHLGMAELKLGYSSVDTYAKDYLLELNDKFIFVSNYNPSLRSENKGINDLDADIWRFGFGRRSGYGYRIGAVSILPYNGGGFVWSRVEMLDFPNSAFKDDLNIIDRYNKSFRFGTQAEGGLKLELASTFSVGASYETAVIFPRHLFWKHAGSFVIESIAMASLDFFIEEIIDSSLAAGPIIDFLLKNGLAYGFFALKKEDMNWPFSTETPLTFETFKVGFTFTF